MKKIYILTVVTTVVFAACNKENGLYVEVTGHEGEIPAGYHLVTLNAKQAGNDNVTTKTTYANDKTFSWASGDAIAVLFNNGNVNKFFEFTTTGTGASASFSGLVEDGYDYEGAMESGTKWALFPYNANHVYTSDTDIQFYLPTGGNGLVCNIPMIAQCPDAEYQFHHLCGALKFTFRGLTANQNVKLQFNSSNTNRRTYGLYSVQGLLSGVSEAIIQGNHIADADNHNANNTTYVTATADAKGIAVVYMPLPLSETSTTTSEYWPSYRFDLFNSKEESILNITTGHFSIDKGKMTVIKPKQLGTEPLGGIAIDGTFADWDVHSERYYGSVLHFIKATADRTNLYLYQRFLNYNFTYSNWDNYQFIYIDIDNDNTTGCTDSYVYRKGAERRWKFFTYFDHESYPYFYRPDESLPFAAWGEKTTDVFDWVSTSFTGFSESTMYKAVKTTEYLDIEYCIPLSTLGITPDPSTTKAFAIGFEGHFKDGAATPKTVYPTSDRLTITIPAPAL